MIWGETWEEEKARLENWHVRFAWFPVWLSDGRWVWLQRYERRRIELGAMPYPEGVLYFWERRPVEDSQQ